GPGRRAAGRPGDRLPHEGGHGSGGIAPMTDASRSSTGWPPSRSQGRREAVSPSPQGGSPMSRRVLAVVLLALAGALAWLAPAAAQGPKVLRVATDTNLPWLDPHMGTAFTLRELSSHVFEGLVTIGEDFAVIPQLAESWTVSADGTEYTFKLRPGVKFHNG